jgi:ribosomal protein L17
MMAVAARSGQLGTVCLIRHDLLHWEMTVKYARSPKLAAQYIKKLIDKYEPDIFVSEDPATATKKAKRTRKILETLTTVAEQSTAQSMQVERIQRHPNKQVEAVQIAKRHPALARYVPSPRRVFDDEPRAYVLFEAIALAEEVICENS